MLKIKGKNLIYRSSIENRYESHKIVISYNLSLSAHLTSWLPKNAISYFAHFIEFL